MPVLTRFFAVLLVTLSLGGGQASADTRTDLAAILDRAGRLEPLETVLVSIDGVVVAERGYRGHSPDRPTNIKSASKAVVSALVGIAIARGVIAGTGETVATLLPDRLPADPDPRLARITVGHLLSMRSGLAAASGAAYGRWVASRDWVRAALAQPFDDEPGGRMIYSTASTHLLSAILTRRTGRPARDLARDWLGDVDGFRIASWDADPQGINFGGNQMAMTPRSLLAFGELYRRGGRTEDGRDVVPGAWVAESWHPWTRSRHTGDGYGYGWFLRRVDGHDVHYAWGYGGQMLYVVPDLDLSVVMTSDETRPSASTGHRDALNALLAEIAGTVAAAKTPVSRSRPPSGEKGAAAFPARGPSAAPRG
jgi:CubicO group peptidase (beta-lactamase class C family)